MAKKPGEQGKGCWGEGIIIEYWVEIKNTL